ncbi:MAG: VCBS repeat-containing protein [Verrucomicrobia bacterium]|nr:VCBS repeat-containing protein [Verrucomicrobiota bacterium]
MELAAADLGDALEISWTSRSVTVNPPFLHYEFQVQTSPNLVDWENLGATIPGGMRETASVGHNARLARDASALFARLTYRLNLPGSDLRGLDFSGTDLRGSDFTGAKLAGASFSGSDLSGASLSAADLTGAVLEGANLQGTDLNGATLNNVSLARILGTPSLNGIEGEDTAPAALALPDLAYSPDFAGFAEDYPGLTGLPVSVNTLIVQVQPAATLKEFNDLLARHGASLVGGIPARQAAKSAVAMLRVPSRTALELVTILSALETEPALSLVVPDTLLSPAAITDDSKAARPDWIWDNPPAGGNWGVEIIRAPQMWNLYDRIRANNPPAGPAIRTAVLEVGFWWKHEDLHNFEYWWPDPTVWLPDNHGTHVSGIIAADWNNGKGIDGVNPFATLWLESTFPPPWVIPPGQVPLFHWFVTEHWVFVGSIMKQVEAILADPSIRILNLSLGYPWDALTDDCSVTKANMEWLAKTQGQMFNNMIQGAGALIVSAAGNDNNTIRNCRSAGTLTIEAKLGSPWNYAGLVLGAPNIIVVGAHDQRGKAARFSNVQPDVLAPGVEIFSTINDSGYGYKTGTSMAAPFVSGLAGYLLAIDPGLTPLELYQLLGYNGQTIDAFKSVMGIDTIRKDTRVLEMLLDIDDGTEDGNTRLEVPPATPGGDRAFAPVEDLAFKTEHEDADGDGWTGDGKINMADFRRWRDWLLFGEGNNGLNGTAQHLKHDANRDGRVDQATEIKLYPRGDFNGDGVMDRLLPAIVGGALGMQMLSDLDVLMSAGSLLFWKDEYYEVADLPELIDSVDITVSAENFFKKNEDVAAGVVNVYDAATDEQVSVGKPFTFSETSPTHIFTVPVGKTYYVSSEPIDIDDGRRLVMRSEPGSYLSVAFPDRGADYVVDLVPSEMTATAKVEPAAGTPGNGPAPQSAGARAAEAGVEVIDSDPVAEEVDAYIEADSGFFNEDEESGGARGWANDQGTFYTLARTGGCCGVGLQTFSSGVVWHRSFTKLPGVPAPTFQVQPMRLTVLDGVVDREDLNAFAEIKVEKRVGASPEWQLVFRTMTEIGGYSEGPGGGHTFAILKHEGDLPQKALTILADAICQALPVPGPDPGELMCVSVYFGATYTQDAYEGTIPIDEVADNGSFEIRYTLEARATALPIDELGEAFIGDPLKYGSGMRMEYGSFGELPRIRGYSTDAQGGGHVSFRSLGKFYYILCRKTGTNTPPVPITMRLSADGLSELIDPAPLSGSTASDYLVKNQPLDQPLDTDGDGIDDVYELLHPNILNPLDFADALADPDQDGHRNLREYLDGTDPAVADPTPPGVPAALYPALVVNLVGGDDFQTADVNNDGHADFVSLGATSLEVELGEGNNSFLPAISMPLPDTFLGGGLLAAKFNADAFVDATVFDSFNNTLLILLGQGNGRFQLHQTYPAPNQPARAVAGDLSNDGVTDLVIVNGAEFSVTVFRGNGDGSFTARPMITFASTPLHAALAKFDADSFADLAVTLIAGQVAILKGNGDGTFGAPQFFSTGRQPQHVAAGDLNGDGRADLITANRTSDDLSVLLGNGDGTFQTETRVATGDSPGALALTDLTGDGRLDVIVSHLSFYHAVLFNDGSGQFTPQTPAFAEGGENVVLADMDRDGRLDLVTPAGSSHIISYGLLGGRFDTRSQVTIPRLSPPDLEIADVNADGQLDVLLANVSANNVEVALGQSNGSFVRATPVPVGADVRGLVAAKLDRGITLDLAVVTERPEFPRGNPANALHILAGDGTGGFVAKLNFTLPNRPSDVLAGDLNGDGDTDLVVMLSFAGQAAPFFNQAGGGFAAGQLLALGGSAFNYALRDLNADGRADLVVTPLVGSDYVLRIYLADGNGTLTQKQEIAEAVGGLKFHDFTGDSRADLVTTVNGQLVYYVAQADGTFGPRTTLLADFGPRLEVEIADVNADGRLDIISGSVIWLAKSDGGFEAPQTYWIPATLPVQVRDLNGDRLPDLIAVDDASDAIQILLHR